MSYVPLRLQSNWSLLKGGSPIEAYVEQAAKWRLPALALTDENLFGAVPFFEAAQRAGVRPILGATVRDDTHTALLLVKNANGYANLCRILSERDLSERFDLASTLCAHAEGLIALCEEAGLVRSVREAFQGRIFRALFSDQALCAPSSNRGLRSTGARPSDQDPCATNAASAHWTQPGVKDLPIVAAPSVLFARPADLEIQHLFSAFRLGKTLASMKPCDAAQPDERLRAPEEMAKLFRDAPEALANTHLIAEQSDFDLLSRDTAFPRIAGREGPARLRAHARAGAQKRYNRITPEIEARLERELQTIIFMGFADYFLVVEEIVRHARRLGTPTAGRGSGAGSLVAYVLQITNVDPLKYDLPFERFLNAGRSDYPDLDVDFCWRLRDDVIDYAYERFGRDHVAMIATYATFRPRMALREVGKVMGLSNPVITEIAKKLRQGVKKDRFDTLPADPGVVERTLSLAQKIVGAPHHLSLHCGGVVITPGPISGYAPLLRAEKGVVITAYDKNGVERVGLVKLDLLGNRSLSTVSEAVDWIKKSTGRTIDPEALPERSKATFDLIRAGRTVGCGQLESPAMRHLLMQMKTGRILEIMQALALIRPGAAGEGMKELFIKRKRGAVPMPRLATCLQKVLGEAFGVMLYEDDAMRIAMEAAGFAPGRADRFRKAITKGNNAALPGGERLEALIETFFQGCAKKGIGGGEAKTLLKMMAKFKSYSFCRAHAASYAQLAYSAAWLKAHYPAAYWTAALNNNEGMYPRWVLVEEAKRSGVKVRLPCVNRSGVEFTLEEGAMRAGLSAIASLSRRTWERIVRERPFTSLEDLMVRAGTRDVEATQLIRCGALDFLGVPRNVLLYKAMTAWRQMREYASVVREGGLDFGLPARFAHDPEPAPILPALGEAQQWKDEWEILGFTCGEHPLAACRPWFRSKGIRMSSAIPASVGRTIRVAGVIAAERRTRTEQGALMQFLTLDDEAGVFEVVLFPEVFRKTRFVLDGPGPYMVEGRVEDQYGAVTMQASRVEAL